MNVRTSCHLPYLSLGCSWEISDSCWWKDGRQEEGQAARPAPAAPMQGVGDVLAPRAAVPAKPGSWMFQGLRPGLES